MVVLAIAAARLQGVRSPAFPAYYSRPRGQWRWSEEDADG
jgi:hypothetical protein